MKFQINKNKVRLRLFHVYFNSEYEYEVKILLSQTVFEIFEKM